MLDWFLGYIIEGEGPQHNVSDILMGILIRQTTEQTLQL